MKLGGHISDIQDIQGGMGQKRSSEACPRWEKIPACLLLRQAAFLTGHELVRLEHICKIWSTILNMSDGQAHGIWRQKIIERNETELLAGMPMSAVVSLPHTSTKPTCWHKQYFSEERTSYNWQHGLCREVINEYNPGYTRSEAQTILCFAGESCLVSAVRGAEEKISVWDVGKNKHGVMSARGLITTWRGRADSLVTMGAGCGPLVVLSGDDLDDNYGYDEHSTTTSTLRVRNLKNGKIMHVLEEDSNIYQVVADHNTNTIVSISQDDNFQSVAEYDLETGKKIWTVDNVYTSGLVSYATSQWLRDFCVLDRKHGGQRLCFKTQKTSNSMEPQIYGNLLFSPNTNGCYFYDLRMGVTRMTGAIKISDNKICTFNGRFFVATSPSSFLVYDCKTGMSAIDPVDLATATTTKPTVEIPRPFGNVMAITSHESCIAACIGPGVSSRISLLTF